MSKLGDLSSAQKMILSGNAVVAIGMMIASIGTLLTLAERGEIATEPLVPANQVNRQPNNPVSAKEYFTS